MQSRCLHSGSILQSCEEIAFLVSDTWVPCVSACQPADGQYVICLATRVCEVHEFDYLVPPCPAYFIELNDGLMLLTLCRFLPRGGPLVVMEEVAALPHHLGMLFLL